MEQKLMVLAIIFLVCGLTTFAIAEQKCWISKSSTFRSAKGENSAIIRWKCREKYDWESIRSSSICALTENGETVCGTGEPTIKAQTGKITDVVFSSSDSPVSDVFIRR